MSDNIINIKVIAADMASKTLRSVNGAAENLGGTLKGKLSDGFNQLRIAATAGTAAVGGLLGYGIKVAADMEKMGVSLKTAFGGNAEAAKQAQAAIVEFAAVTPYELDEVMGAFIKLKNFGLDPSQEAMTAYGDTASAMGKSLDQMVEAVADATTMQFERLKEFGIRSEQEGENVTFTFKGIRTTVKKDAQEIEKYLINLGKTQFTGGMEEQSKTLLGRLSTLKDSFGLFLGEVITSTGIYDGFKSIVEGVTEWIGKNKDAVIKFVRDGLQKLQDTIKQVVEFLVKLKESLFKNDEEFVKFLKTMGLVAAIVGVAGVAFGVLTSPIILITALIAGISFVMTKLGINVEDVIAFIINAFQRVWEFLTGITNAIAEVISAGWQIIKTIVETIVGAIVAVVTFAFQAIQEFLTPAMSAIGEVISAGWQIVKTIIETIMGVIVGIVRFQIDLILGIIQVLASFLGIDLAAAWEGVKTIVENVWNGITGFIKGAIDSIIGFIQGAIKTINDLITLLKQALGLQDKVNAPVESKPAPSPFESGEKAFFSGKNNEYIVPSFATGGIVPGTSTSGDKVLARVNSGEMILNKGQQSKLFGMFDSNNSNGDEFGGGGLSAIDNGSRSGSRTGNSGGDKSSAGEPSSAQAVTVTFNIYEASNAKQVAGQVQEMLARTILNTSSGFNAAIA